MDLHGPLILIAVLAAGSLAGCHAPSDPPSTTPAPSGDAQPAAPDAPAEAPSMPPPAPDVTPPPAEVPATPPATPSTDFAAAPSKGTVIRANCRMGGCWWYRFDEVVREDAAPPRYRLRLTGGESSHGQDPYPANAEGVDIKWDAKSAAATVACSREAPKVAYEGDARTLKLNPQGVSGVEQGVANLYFATCHGEYGDDGKLAAKYGYDLK